MIKANPNIPNNSAGSDQSAIAQSASREAHFVPQTFIRHHIQLKALLLHAEAWFCARDIGRLMGVDINGRYALKLDADQRRMMCLSGSDDPQETLMLSESGVYAMLVYHYCPENRNLRCWLTHHVVPMLRDGGGAGSNQAPSLRLMEWAGGTLSLLHWRTEPWVRLKDMPCLLGAGYSGVRGF
ncbi:Bro-N domain-containing protein [Pseudomonas sp. dw_612]|uniref:BRO-N domain-containing protein n=1 Tax=Pseudomonas sp. dw_612 TaxID=2720080 RepID=UPI001BD20FFA|nr:Bro-N domain-containing protein [Pseudomonas sp. dw_612]